MDSPPRANGLRAEVMNEVRNMTTQDAQTERRMVPLREGIFRLPSAGEEAALIGSRCPDCGKCFFPRRHVCLNCSRQGLDEAPLSRRGQGRALTTLPPT